MLQYDSVSRLALLASERGVNISEVVLADQSEQLEVSRETILKKMAEHLEVMRQSAIHGQQPDIRSVGGLTGGDGYRMLTYAKAGNSISGDFCAAAISKAIAVNESNAAMGKIVAAPTAGSCGILPGAVLTMMEQRGISEDAAVLALVTAGALGLVIANEASIAGAEGGCMAECGSAAAMTAGALVELCGGTPEMVCHACAIAIKNQLGLVCDPVAGLVEVPCVKRNAGGVMCAITAADMALAGIKSVIPVDEVIGAMREVGNAIPNSLCETAQGGLAATPTGRAIEEAIFGKRA